MYKHLKKVKHYSTKNDYRFSEQILLVPIFSLWGKKWQGIPLYIK